jgi:hypothetical protein
MRLTILSGVIFFRFPLVGLLIGELTVDAPTLFTREAAKLALYIFSRTPFWKKKSPGDSSTPTVTTDHWSYELLW